MGTPLAEVALSSGFYDQSHFHRHFAGLIGISPHAYRLNRNAPRSAALPVYLGATFAIGVILATTQAAPQMLSLSHVGNDPVVLQGALDTFEFWQAIRTGCIALGYVSNLWALLCIVSSDGKVVSVRGETSH